MRANTGQREPMQAREGSRQPTQAHKGSQKPMQANDGMNGGPNDATRRSGPGTFLFDLLIHFTNNTRLVTLL